MLWRSRASDRESDWDYRPPSHFESRGVPRHGRSPPVTTHLDRDTTRLGILTMLIAVLLFSLNDVMGKWLVSTYPIGQLLLIRSAAALLILSPFIYRAGWRSLFDIERPGLHGHTGLPDDNRSFELLLCRRLYAAGGRHHLLDGGAYLCRRAVSPAAGRACRLAALDGDRRRLCRCSDCAAAVVRQLHDAGADRPVRQPLLCLDDDYRPRTARLFRILRWCSGPPSVQRCSE